MIAKHIFFDGKNILGTSEMGILFTQKDWRNNLSVRDVSVSREGGHGRDVTATFAEIRTITLSGIIDIKTNEKHFEAVKFLENLFSLQTNPSILTPHTLKVIDFYDREWVLPVKIKDPITFDDGDENFSASHWRWMVTLESLSDPTFFSENENEVQGQE